MKSVRFQSSSSRVHLELHRSSDPRARRGVATVWLVLFLPLLLLLLCFVVEIGNLWMARAELETALEAAALAAVKEWGDNSGGDTLVERNVGVTVAAANDVRGNPLVIVTNYNNANPNDNSSTAVPSATANLIFGAITSTNPTVVLNAGVVPTCPTGVFGVLAQEEVTITPVCGSLFGAVLGPYTVRGRSVAMYNCTDRCPTAVRVDTYVP